MRGQGGVIRRCPGGVAARVQDQKRPVLLHVAGAETLRGHAAQNHAGALDARRQRHGGAVLGLRAARICYQRIDRRVVDLSQIGAQRLDFVVDG
jgi:hypothetical protein